MGTNDTVKTFNWLKSIFFLFLSGSGMFGAANFPAGRGKDENPRGGAKVKIHGAGQKARKLK